MIDSIIFPGTKFKIIDSIYQILDPDFEKKLDHHIHNFSLNKANLDIDQIKDHEQLPFIRSDKYKMDWRLRQEDLSNIRREIGNKQNLSILEIGPYNSWLTHHLHNDGHKVVSMDYFVDEAYGLKSKYYYKDHNWLSIQCNLEKLDFLKPCFDIIVLNHGIHFFSNAEIPIIQLKRLLKPNGKLIILGLFIFIDESLKKKEVAEYKAKFKEKIGSDMFMYPSVKGYLDASDLQILKQHQIKLIQYKCCLLNNIAAKIYKRKQLYYWGFYPK